MYRIHHVCLSVSNRETSVAFYKKLGFTDHTLWQAEDGSLTITHLKLNGIILELFCYKNPTPAPDSIFSTKTDIPVIGTKHFALCADSIEEARDDLAKKGLVEPDTEITQGRTGLRYFFITDPDGIQVEIVEDKA